jgi:hypothetical protein
VNLATLSTAQGILTLRPYTLTDEGAPAIHYDKYVLDGQDEQTMQGTPRPDSPCRPCVTASTAVSKARLSSSPHPNQVLLLLVALMAFSASVPSASPSISSSLPNLQSLPPFSSYTVHLAFKASRNEFIRSFWTPWW